MATARAARRIRAAAKRMTAMVRAAQKIPVAMKRKTATGVELPRITVTVVEDSSQEEEIAPSYASMPADEVAPVAERADTIGVKPASADNAGDRHKVRILWQTVKTVSKNATSTGCKKSWIGIRVPGMSGDQKYYFNKEMLTDSSRVYTLAEFTLPNTYEGGQDMFPDKLGSYSALSLISGQFKGRVTLQVYDYVLQDWEPVSGEVTLDGGIDQKGEATLTENGQYRMKLTYGEKGTENAPSQPRHRTDTALTGGPAGWTGRRSCTLTRKESLLTDGTALRIRS